MRPIHQESVFLSRARSAPVFDQNTASNTTFILGNSFSFVLVFHRTETCNTASNTGFKKKNAAETEGSSLRRLNMSGMERATYVHRSVYLHRRGIHLNDALSGDLHGSASLTESADQCDDDDEEEDGQTDGDPNLFLWKDEDVRIKERSLIIIKKKKTNSPCELCSDT